VVVPGTASYSEWRARYEGLSWVAILDDGTVPLDLETDHFSLYVAAPDSRYWRIPIPKEAPDGYEIRLEAGSARYRGRLLDDTGAPRGGLRLYATPLQTAGSPAIQVSCMTAADGQFELSGLAPCVHCFEFNDPVDDASSPWQGIRFTPLAPASDDGWLEIRLERPKEKIRVHGVVRHEADGTPLSDARLSFECQQAMESGTLGVVGEHSFGRTDATGSFEILMPRTPILTIRVYGSSPKDGPVLTRTFEDSGMKEELTLELIVP
jgi:hypothetical protein